MVKTKNLNKRKRKLVSFLGFLKEKLGFDFDINKFLDRFRLQKYVFFARKFGLDLDYEYKIYKHGPYSKSLANDYYDLFKKYAFPWRLKFPKEYKKNFKDYQKYINLKEKELLSLLKKKDKKWLEVAATAVDLYEYNDNYKQREKLISKTAEIKSNKDEELIIEVIDYLGREGTIQFN